MYRRALAALVVSCLLAAPVFAADGKAASGGRVRPLSPQLGTLIRLATEGSPAFRALLQRVNASNLIVYVEYYRYAAPTIGGRVVFLHSQPDRRYIVVRLPPMRLLWDDLNALGHEFCHAAEIADTPSIVDLGTLEQHFQRAGYVSYADQGAVAYETVEAQLAGRQVQHEVEDSLRRGAVRAADDGQR